MKIRTRQTQGKWVYFGKLFQKTIFAHLVEKKLITARENESSTSHLEFSTDTISVARFVCDITDFKIFSHIQPVFGHKVLSNLPALSLRSLSNATVSFIVKKLTMKLSVPFIPNFRIRIRIQCYSIRRPNQIVTIPKNEYFSNTFRIFKIINCAQASVKLELNYTINFIPEAIVGVKHEPLRSITGYVVQGTRDYAKLLSFVVFLMIYLWF